MTSFFLLCLIRWIKNLTYVTFPIISYWCCMSRGIFFFFFIFVIAVVIFFPHFPSNLITPFQYDNLVNYIFFPLLFPFLRSSRFFFFFYVICVVNFSFSFFFSDSPFQYYTTLYFDLLHFLVFLFSFFPVSTSFSFFFESHVENLRFSSFISVF